MFDKGKKKSTKAGFTEDDNHNNFADIIFFHGLIYWLFLHRHFSANLYHHRGYFPFVQSTARHDKPVQNLYIWKFPKQMKIEWSCP